VCYFGIFSAKTRILKHFGTFCYLTNEIVAEKPFYSLVLLTTVTESSTGNTRSCSATFKIRLGVTKQLCKLLQKYYLSSGLRD